MMGEAATTCPDCGKPLVLEVVEDERGWVVRSWCCGPVLASGYFPDRAYAQMAVNQGWW